MEYNTTYDVAVHWCNNSYVMCNNIPEIDPNIWEIMVASKNKEDETNEIMQWFISDCTGDDVEFLTEHFDGMIFAYSTKLDKWVLCVDHWGTSWDYCYCSTDMENAKCDLGTSIKKFN